MSALITATAQTVTIGVVFSWIVLLPAIATVLIIVSIVAGRGEKAEDEALSGRWGRRARPDDD
jgi:hypothetical protein